MSNSVLLLDKAKLDGLMAHYAAFKVTRNAPGVVFAAKLPDAAITAYKSGKVLFQGGGAMREAAIWGSVDGQKSPTKPTAKGEILPERFSELSVVGSDETGTGDFFGPVTVAACYVSSEQIELVRELGVKDSKQLNDDYMRQIAPDLQAALIHSVLTLTNDKYNKVQEKGWSQGKIKALLHNQALKHVLRKMKGEKPDYILIDQFAERGIYYNHIKNEQEIVRENVLFSTKAEGLHLAVAAASIIARVAFLEEMDRLSDLAGVQLPKGAGKIVDEAAAKILLKSGEDTLKSMTKWHFANAQKAKKIAALKRKL
ncbi:ribonuclease HIII [Sporosarcina thermotolerans]|uniref:Ribonuclease HIII n=1 Tax=Sporosarcina thermotolerans TaxID=633404 RepID=A0AAW9ACV7_9BACL|nr:ribonuclease HIII [Sporosarcina thermotolerans]MDW0118170.1 ribonuclease HIII [Sporosarcina thermotolerans]